MMTTASTTSQIQVLSVDDHPLLREGIGAIINSQPDMNLIGSAANGKEAIDAFRRLKPDVVLLDLQLPDLSGIEVLIAIRNEFPPLSLANWLYTPGSGTDTNTMST